MSKPLATLGVSDHKIRCSIKAAKESLVHELGTIARYCAIDLKLPIPLSIDGSKGRAAHITLSVDLESALLSDAVWKLASRIASFCPQARVSAHILTNSPAETQSYA